MHNVIFDSGPFAPVRKNVKSSKNRKYTTTQENRDAVAGNMRKKFREI